MTDESNAIVYNYGAIQARNLVRLRQGETQTNPASPPCLKCGDRGWYLVEIFGSVSCCSCEGKSKP